MKERFLNPFTDFGFKKLFGEEPNKDLLISFLNTLLPQKHQISDLQYTKNEYLGQTQIDRKAIFDLHCKNSQGEYFIVELQKAKQKYFKDRSVYYATFPIQAQAEQGEWDFRLQAVYTVGILDFVFDDDDGNEVIHTVQLKNQQHQIFYDKLTFIYLTLPNFDKTLEQLVTLQDKWFYVFRHLQELKDIPSALQEAVFTKLFKIAELANFTPQDRQAYQDSLKYYRDLRNVINTAIEEAAEKAMAQGIAEGKAQGIAEGKAQGIAEGKAQGIAEGIVQSQHNTALAMFAKGFTVEVIAELLMLDVDTVQQLLQNQ